MSDLNTYVNFHNYGAVFYGSIRCEKCNEYLISTTSGNQKCPNCDEDDIWKPNSNY